jgi:hypothetical protein
MHTSADIDDSAGYSLCFFLPVQQEIANTLFLMAKTIFGQFLANLTYVNKEHGLARDAKAISTELSTGSVGIQWS